MRALLILAFTLAACRGEAVRCWADPAVTYDDGRHIVTTQTTHCVER